MHAKRIRWVENILYECSVFYGSPRCVSTTGIDFPIMPLLFKTTYFDLTVLSFIRGSIYDFMICHGRTLTNFLLVYDILVSWVITFFLIKQLYCKIGPKRLYPYRFFVIYFPSCANRNAVEFLRFFTNLEYFFFLYRYVVSKLLLINKLMKEKFN